MHSYVLNSHVISPAEKKQQKTVGLDCLLPEPTVEGVLHLSLNLSHGWTSSRNGRTGSLSGKVYTSLKSASIANNIGEVDGQSIPTMTMSDCQARPSRRAHTHSVIYHARHLLSQNYSLNNGYNTMLYTM